MADLSAEKRWAYGDALTFEILIIQRKKPLMTQSWHIELLIEF